MIDKNKTWLCDNCLSYNIQISDIKDSEHNLFSAEITLNHDLNLKKGGSLNTGVDDFDKHPMNYKVPNFGVDQDILDT